MADNREWVRPALEKLGYSVQWQGQGKPLLISKGGKTQEFSDYTYDPQTQKSYVAPESLAKLTGYAPVRSTLEGAGYGVGWDAEKGQVQVVNPFTGQQYETKPPVIWGNRAYADPGLLESIQSRLGPTPGRMEQEFNQYTKQQNDLINTALNNMNAAIAKQSDAAIKMYQEYQQQFGAALDQLRSLMQPRSDVPESVKVALDMLKQQTDENVKALGEEMNRRGIYQSGIAIDEERKLRDKMTMAQRQTLAQWLDEQHKQMYQAALALANMQAQYARGLPNIYAQAYIEPLKQQANLAATEYQMRSGLNKEAYSARQQLFDAILRRVNAQQQAQTEMQKALLPYQYPTAYQQGLLDLKNQYQNNLYNHWNAVSSRQGAGLSKNDKLAGILQGAADQVRNLMTQGEIRGDERMAQFVRLTPEEAANKVTQSLYDHIADLGLSYTDIENIIKFINQVAGVQKPLTEVQRRILSAIGAGG